MDPSSGMGGGEFGQMSDPTQYLTPNDLISQRSSPDFMPGGNYQFPFFMLKASPKAVSEQLKKKNENENKTKQSNSNDNVLILFFSVLSICLGSANFAEHQQMNEGLVW